MTESFDPTTIRPDVVFDGGDLDCGSGLVLLIREHMLQVPLGGVLEMRSREPTVRDDLPPWCRMAGHEYLGAAEGEGYARFFVRRGGGGSGATTNGGTGAAGSAEGVALQADKEAANTYEWRVRARSTGRLRSTVYSRNFSFDVGQPASFEEKDEHPSAVEYVLGALSASLTTALATACSRAGLEVDDIEISTRGRLGNPLAHLGLGEGSPAFTEIEVRCYVSTFDDEDRVAALWEETVARSPVAATLRATCNLKLRLAFV
jgi:TusA-related sulfurtransferase